jgi:hypothetical protein
LIAYGFPADQNIDGKEVVKNDGISNEKCQRAKILNHQAQITLRKEVIERAMRKELEKRQRGEMIAEELLRNNKNCEETILKELNTMDQNLLVTATKKEFTKPLLKELRAFIHVRMFDSPSSPTGYTWTKKGNLKDAEENKDCLILRAFNLRNKLPLKVKVHSAESDISQGIHNEEGNDKTLMQSGTTPQKAASEYLRDVNFQEAATEMFFDSENLGIPFINENDCKRACKRADELEKIMLQ